MGRLQSGKDPECRLFQKIAEQGHYAGQTVPSATRQGTYATTADGRLLASWNSNDPRFVAKKLREAVAKWDELQAKGDAAAADSSVDLSQVDRDEQSYPEDGLVLKVNTRDLPREKAVSGRWADAWNQDFAWFTRNEASEFVPSEVKVGATQQVPQKLMERLARFHFVDNVRGQTSPLPAKAIEKAELTSTVTRVDGSVVSLRLEGLTRAEQTGNWPIQGYRDMNRPSEQKRGIALKLLGNAKFDRSTGRFVAFEMVGIGDRWGGTQYNGRGRDLDPQPYGVALTLGGDSRAERVAPEHFWGYGWKR